MKMTVFTDHLRLKGLFSNEFYEMKMIDPNEPVFNIGTEFNNYVH